MILVKVPNVLHPLTSGTETKWNQTPTLQRGPPHMTPDLILVSKARLDNFSKILVIKNK